MKANKSTQPLSEPIMSQYTDTQHITPPLTKIIGRYINSLSAGPEYIKDLGVFQICLQILNLRALKFKILYETGISQCMG